MDSIDSIIDSKGTVVQTTAYTVGCKQKSETEREQQNNGQTEVYTLWTVTHNDTPKGIIINHSMTHSQSPWIEQIACWILHNESMESRYWYQTGLIRCPRATFWSE